MDNREQRQLQRLLRRFAEGDACLSCLTSGQGVLVTFKNGQKRQLSSLDLSNLAARDYIRMTEYSATITDAGRAKLARLSAVDGAERFRIQHEDRRHCAGPDGDIVTVNMEESPLMRLSRLKGHDGGAWFEPRELAAGERIRRDFELAQMRQRVTMSYDPGRIPGDKGGRGANPVTQMSDRALMARDRFDGAICVLGPELVGVAMDVCCFLKGLERVESERGWPRRSAKLLLKAALGALSRHYFPVATGKSSSPMRHWGDADYRPALNPE